MSLSIELRLSPESFSNWKKHPGTQEFFKQLNSNKNLLLEDLLAGATIEKPFAAQSTARSVGRIETIDSILNITYEDR